MVATASGPYRASVTLSRLILRIRWAVHRTLFSLTGGRVGAAPPRGGVGTLFLLSRGRKSGKLRRNGLYYVEDPPNLAVVASNAGENADPQWWKNLQATPDADVELGTHRQPIRARRGDAGGDRAALAAVRRRSQGVRRVPGAGLSADDPGRHLRAAGGEPGGGWFGGGGIRT